MSPKNANFQNFENFSDFTHFFWWPISKILRLKINKFELKSTYFKIKINGAKHSPLPSTLGRPSAGFGGSRATAWF